MGSVAIALAVAQAIPAMVEAGHSVASILALWGAAGAVMTKAHEEGRDPSAAEWAALNAAIDAKVAFIDAG